MSFTLDGSDGFRCYWHYLRNEPKIISRNLQDGGGVWGAISNARAVHMGFVEGSLNVHANIS